MITFISGTMNSGKTAQSVMLSHSLKKQDKRVKVYKVQPEREGAVASQLSSRAGVSCECTLIGPSYDFSSYIRVNFYDIDVIIVDECQFLSIEQIDYLAYCGVEVIFSGLKVNYKGEMFEASERILIYADKEVKLPSYCSSPGCKNLATHHILEIDGKVIKDGCDKMLGDIEGESVKYSTVCKKHYIFKVTLEEDIIKSNKEDK